MSGLTPRALSLRAGLDHTHVRRIEAGDRVEIAASTAVGLAEVLGVSVEWLVKGSGREPTAQSVRRAVNLAATGTEG